MQELENRVVIITGAAGSLGSTTATTFAAQGATVVLVDIHRERLEEVQKQLPDGVESSVIETNLLEQSSVDAMAEAVVAKYGTIDMIANIAGGFTMGPPVHETSDRDWDFMMDLNLRSIFHTSRAVIPVMLKNGGGRIVNIHMPWGTGVVYWDAGGRLSGNNNRLSRRARPGEFKGRWNHWAFTKDARSGEMAIYLNGELWHSAGNMTKTMPPMDSFVIGANLDEGGVAKAYDQWEGGWRQQGGQEYHDHGVAAGGDVYFRVRSWDRYGRLSGRDLDEMPEPWLGVDLTGEESDDLAIHGELRDAIVRGLRQAAAENADEVIVTDDNPRSEDPGLIRGAVLEGAPDAAEVADRAEAIGSRDLQVYSLLISS